MALDGCVIGVTGNFDRQILTNAVRKAGGRVDAIVHKNLHYVREPSVCVGPAALFVSSQTDRVVLQLFTYPSGSVNTYLLILSLSLSLSLSVCACVQLISDEAAIERNTQRIRKVKRIASDVETIPPETDTMQARSSIRIESNVNMTNFCHRR